MGAAFLLAWVYYFTRRALFCRFQPDEMMNIYYYWIRSPWALFHALVDFPSTFYRPLGGAYYRLLFHFFGLNPLPYHIAISSFMVVNTFLAWRIARLVCNSSLTAYITALIYCYHKETALAYYMGSYVYDVLCCTFWLAALSVYVSGRHQGRRLSRTRLTCFLLLYVCALDAKEMAVTLPVILLAYEWIFHAPPSLSRVALSRWIRTSTTLALAAALITAVYIHGKLTGPDSLIGLPAYQPVFTSLRYFESTCRFAATFLYLRGALSPAIVVLIAAAMLYFALHTRKRELLLALVIIVIGPLPIVFIDRGGPELLIPYFGWALSAAVALRSIVSQVAHRADSFRVPGKWVEPALLTLALLLFARLTRTQTRSIASSIEHTGTRTSYPINQVRAVQPAI